jgi:hypothetical protein
MTKLANLRAAALGMVAATTWLAAAPLSAAPAQQDLSFPDNAPPPPPPAATVRETPPPPVGIATRQVEPAPPPKVTFRVRVTGAGQELWMGDMTLEGYQGAELQMSLQQADSACPGSNELRSRRRTGLTFTMRYAGRRDTETLAITSEWTRQSRDCDMPGTRTTGIETALPIPQGATRVIEADGGLRIDITRKP